MKKKCIRFIMVLVILFNTFLGNFVYVEAKSSSSGQPEVCNGPSEMMSHYFNFQDEAISILLGSNVNARRYATSRGEGGLFTNKVLNLPGSSAIDFLATDMLGSTKSFLSNTVTSFVLFLLASASVVQSNFEGFAILFKDRPIVRDYKKMLEIETELFDVAYFRSKQINLTQPFDSDISSQFYDLIKKYQDLGLFETGTVRLDGESMADIISNLIAMNAVMKQFIMVGGRVGRNGLENYAMCASDLGSDCSGVASALRFSRGVTGAINQLDEDYKEVRQFSKCNSYANLFRGTLNKTIKNNSEMVKSSVNDIGEAMKRLGGALGGKNNGKKQENRCDVSDYEMAQLQAYWGGTWECNTKLVDVDVNESLSEDIRTYFNEKQAKRKHKLEQKGLLETSETSNSSSTIGNISDKIAGKMSNSEKEQVYRKMIGSGIFNPDFLFSMNDEFVNVFETTIIDIWQAQENAISADVSDLFGRGKGILDTLDSVIKKSGDGDKKQGLKNHLQKIEDKQCTG